MLSGFYISMSVEPETNFRTLNDIHKKLAIFLILLKVPIIPAEVARNERTNQGNTLSNIVNLEKSERADRKLTSVFAYPIDISCGR
ncbi:hypothetical protein WA026_014820 [Henosepilachna vigintioctopunctata]|uniref:Uncharacterized protein n=1 Tax=Henosepilachna vigintioctopunctata TaxID=420089 RepID=A0AAW1UY69_9CUCU